MTEENLQIIKVDSIGEDSITTKEIKNIQEIYTLIEEGEDFIISGDDESRLIVGSSELSDRLRSGDFTIYSSEGSKK